MFQQPKRLARLKQKMDAAVSGEFSQFQQPKRLARLKPPALFPVVNQELTQLFRGRVKNASATWLERSVSGRNIAENVCKIKLPWHKMMKKVITD